MITINNLLFTQVQTIIDKVYDSDPCKPTHIISSMEGDVILTITHLGTSQSSRIGFLTDISSLIEKLYNKTM